MRIYEVEHHGMSKTLEYGTWAAMNTRCYNIKDKCYKHYGGRGITVCDRWHYSFNNFYKDMGDRPFPKAQIDRINNDGNYEPSNCRWVTCAENNRNKPNLKLNIETAKVIRELYKTTGLTQLQIGDIYNVSEISIWKIIHNRMWV